MKTIPLYVESERGHDTLNVPANQLQNAVESQLKDDKWVTMEKKGGSTEILTAKDIPKEEKSGSNEDWKNSFKADSKPMQTATPATASSNDKKEWAKKFEKVKSATSTNKAKGG